MRSLVIADVSEVRVVAESTGSFYGQAMTAGNIYRVAGNGTLSSGNGGKARHAELYFPGGLAVTAGGNELIADGEQVRMVPSVPGTYFGRPMIAGYIYAVAGTGYRGYSGDGGPATSAKLGGPGGLVMDDSGNLIIADSGNDRVRVVAGSTGTFYGQAMVTGDIYTIAGNGTEGFAGDGGPATAAEFDGPSCVAVDSAGNVLISDTGNNRIRVVAESTGAFYGQAMTAGDIYTIAGTGRAGFSGDGGPATSAEMNLPQGLALDGSGNVVLADSSSYRVRVVAVRSGLFYGQAMTAGDIYTIAGTGTPGFGGDGGPATAASLDPQGIAIGPPGNVAIADKYNNRVRMVAEATGTFYGQAMAAGDIYTVAGNGSYGESGDGGPPAKAELSWPVALGFDGAADLVIVDSGFGRVRMVTP